MKLLPDWKTVLRNAWSVRLAALAALLSAAEVVLPMFFDVFNPGVFAAMSGLVAMAGAFVRLVAQPAPK
ncbi:MAG TPA: hypothetical protein P5305_04035 [Rubrivivax sp.]|nr:hypothetical protein [Rubrivivax sp.]HRY87032.1 hypothetical protein [Rubrivivax sp.]